MKKALTTALAVLLALPAAAQQSNCGPRDFMVKALAEKYSESRQSIGLMDNGFMVEMYASEISGTWTILVTRPTGVACLVASGQSYEAVEEEIEESPGMDL